ncbi:hypothetical protein E2C01_075663 [Portunus trituberculatus]|uniref:Uncharacterized protein n=1 Tax=Portunus trituberculatus TaxID=210409 RepID=A0A5B7IFJ7_PORTR|nr:hypothetical protein [Portunus trituberculatus]
MPGKQESVGTVAVQPSTPSHKRSSERKFRQPTRHYHGRRTLHPKRGPSHDSVRGVAEGRAGSARSYLNKEVKEWDLLPNPRPGPRVEPDSHPLLQYAPPAYGSEQILVSKFPKQHE